MNQTLLTLLGKFAHITRSRKLGLLLDLGLDCIDYVFAKINKPPLHASFGGFRIYGYTRHRSFLENISTGQYEPFASELFEKALRPGMVVLDGGAHIGLYSIMASHLLGPNGKVISFEPDPYNFRALTFNIQKNNKGNIVPIQKALSNTTGETLFFRSPGTIGNSLIKRTNIGKVYEIPVTTTTVDIELEELPVDSVLLKLDVEGAEPLVIRGAMNVLKSINSITILAEINPSALSDAGSSPQELIELLGKLNFEIFFVDESAKKLIPVTDRTLPLKKGMIYCTRGPHYG